jgi:hypothetical protein
MRTRLPLWISVFCTLATVACSDTSTTQDAADAGVADTVADTPDAETPDTTPGPPEVTTTTLGWISVQEGQLVDEFGRQWLVRGINARVEGLFDVTFDDGRIALQPIPDWTADDAARAAAMGFNMLRLPINWSGLEPTEGEFNEVYFSRLLEVVELTTRAGMYVLLDFHQDAWSKEVGEDGAPLWAIVPPPTQLLQGPLNDLSQRRVSAQVLAAFAGFYTNRENIQDRFLPVFSEVVTRYADNSGVIGVEIQNEPVTSSVNNGDALLQQFYERFAARMRELDPRHTIWMEPDSLRNFTNSAPLREQPFPDDNIVYTPHLYPGLTGMRETTVEGWKRELQPTFDSLMAESASWGGAVVWGEWGDDPNGETAASYWRAIDELSDERLVGHAYWLWKERSQGFWGFFTYDETTDTWTERADAIAGYIRPAAMAVPGRMVSHASDRDAGTLVVTFEARGGEAAPLIYLPPTAEWQVTLNGTALQVEPDAAGRVLLPWEGEAGAYEIRAARQD